MADIAVLGLGKLGSCVAAALACAGHHVVGVDLDLTAVHAINANTFRPEPGLNDAIDRAGSRLYATTVTSAAVKDCAFTFIVVPTPSTGHGDFDDTLVTAAVAAVAEAESGWPVHTVIVASTVSPGSMARLKARYETDRLRLVYSPLFIALGQVLADIEHPDFRLVGADDTDSAEAVCDLLETLGPAPLMVMGSAEAEVVKLSVNAFLVTKAAFSDTVAQACMRAGVDASTVLGAVGMDRRIGWAFMRPGASPGGPCLPRDAKALRHWLDRHHIPDDLPRAVDHIRQHQLTMVCQFFAAHWTVAILGMSYKPGTPVTDASLGTLVAARLEQAGKAVICSDPYLDGPSAKEAIADADAVLVACPHPEYRQLDTAGKPTLDMWRITAPGPQVTVWGRG